MAPKITPSRTALLLLDLQVIHAQASPKFATLMTHTSSLITTCRNLGITIAHCRAAFTPSEISQIPETNKAFYAVSQSPSARSKFLIDSPSAAFHAAVAPQEGDIVLRKYRVGPFLNSPDDVDAIFKGRGIDTLVLAGVSTGGAVAATVVQAADLDYGIFVVEDCCGDRDEVVHEFFMRFFEKRGSVVESGEIEGLCSKS